MPALWQGDLGLGKSVKPRVAEVMAKHYANKHGSRPHEPSEENKKDVVRFASVGMPHDAIATLLDISQDTLEKHYVVELQKGMSVKKKMLTTWAFGAAQKGSIPMLIFLCKTQLGWKETSNVEVSGQIDIKPVINFISSQAQKLEEEKQKLLLEEPNYEHDTTDPEDK